jgi:hypothetical protein
VFVDVSGVDVVPNGGFGVGDGAEAGFPPLN